MLFTFGWISICSCWCYCYFYNCCCFCFCYHIFSYSFVSGFSCYFPFSEWFPIEMQLLNLVWKIAVHFSSNAHASTYKTMPVMSWSYHGIEHSMIECIAKNCRWLIECLERHSRIQNGHIRHFECKIIALLFVLETIPLSPSLLPFHSPLDQTAWAMNAHYQCTSCSTLFSVRLKWNIYIPLSPHRKTISWLISAKSIRLLDERTN